MNRPRTGPRFRHWTVRKIGTRSKFRKKNFVGEMTRYDWVTMATELRHKLDRIRSMNAWFGHEIPNRGNVSCSPLSASWSPVGARDCTTSAESNSGVGGVVGVVRVPRSLNWKVARNEWDFPTAINSARSSSISLTDFSSSEPSITNRSLSTVVHDPFHQIRKKFNNSMNVE